MKLFFWIVSVVLMSTIGVPAATKIEIYEIRENDNGVHLKNLNPRPKASQNVDPLLKLLRVPKSKIPENKVFKFAKKLLSKLKSLRGEEYAKVNDDAYIYIVNNDDWDVDSSQEETLFIDKTRNDRTSTNIEQKDIRNLLLQLLQPERKIPLQMKRKLRQTQVQLLGKPVLRIIDDGVLNESKTRPKYAYEYVDDNGVQNNTDREDQ